MIRFVAGKPAAASPEHPEAVWNWYQFQRRILGEELRRARTAFAGPRGAADLERVKYGVRTLGELEIWFREQGYELDLLTMLGMLAATEAHLQIDFQVRAKRKLRDDVSKAFKKADDEKGRKRINLEDDILDTWRDKRPERETKECLSQFKGALNLRHWLAHGRHWEAKLGRDYTTQDVRTVCLNVLNALGIQAAFRA